MVHRSPRHSYRDLRFLIQRSFEGITGFGDRVEIDGKIHRIAEGIWHDNYWFFIRGSNLPSVRTEQAYVLQLLQSRLGEIDGDLFAEFPLADQVHDWVANYLPSDDQTCVLHGDLLPQNLLHDWQSTSDSEGVVAVVDWEMAQIGDPAYDLAIVSRGNQKILGEKDGLQMLLDKYAKFSGRKISLADVRVHELLLILHWLEESWREHQKPKPSGHGPEYYEAKLQSLFRRTVSCRA